MAKMNDLVESQGKEQDEVARNYLERNKFIEGVSMEAIIE